MKKNLTFAKLVMFVIMAVLPLSMMAQEGKKKSKPAERYWYIQADGGLSINHGDLANYNGGIWDDFDHFKTMAFQNFTKNWNAHFGVGYQFGKVVGLNLKGGYGLLSGHKHLVDNDPNQTAYQALVFTDGPEGTYYNLGFEGTNYIEGNLNLTFNLFNMFNYNPRRVINLVPHIGIGGIYYKAGAVSQLTYDPANNVDEVAAEVAAAKENRDLPSPFPPVWSSPSTSPRSLTSSSTTPTCSPVRTTSTKWPSQLKKAVSSTTRICTANSTSVSA
jgi:hypothetical protein